MYRLVAGGLRDGLVKGKTVITAYGLALKPDVKNPGGVFTGQRDRSVAGVRADARGPQGGGKEVQP